MKTCAICGKPHERAKLTCSPECAAEYSVQHSRQRRHQYTPETALPEVRVRNAFLLGGVRRGG